MLRTNLKKSFIVALATAILIVAAPTLQVEAGLLDALGAVGKIGGGLILGGGAPSTSDDVFDGGDDIIVTSGEDVIAKALDQIKLGEKIVAKTREMENQVAKVFVRIRTYQAMQGGIWFNLGKSYYELRNDLLDLDRQGGCSAKEFSRRTKQKRLSQIKLLNQVEIKAADGLADTAETINLNNKTNLNLRRSVSEVISQNPLLAFGFTSQVESQNRSLDNLLQSYSLRVGDIYLAFNAAENTFKKIGKEFGQAEKEMGVAIKKYNEQSKLVAGEATKHVGILALHGAKLSSLLKDHNRSFWQNIQLAAQVSNLLKRIGKLTHTLNVFSKTRKKFARQSATIREAGSRAREEISASGITIRSLRKKLNKSWDNQIAAIDKAAANEKLKIKNLSQEMAAIEKKNRKQVGRMYAHLHDEAKKKADKAFGKPVF